MTSNHSQTGIRLKKGIVIALLILVGGYGCPTPLQSQPPDAHPAADTTEQDTVTWSPPRFDERQAERDRLAELMIKQGIHDSAVVEAIRNVPRHLFVPKRYRMHAYRNRPLPIGDEQTISQPYIVAYMTQLLEIEETDKVLEIGTGSGYQAAVLSELTPHVFTIEIIEGLARQAQNRFERLGYETIKTKIGDGYKGWEKHAPFDALIVTAAADEIPPPLIRQLKTGGTLVMPKGDVSETQTLIRVTKNKDGSLTHETKLPVRFVPMTGEVQEH